MIDFKNNKYLVFFIGFAILLTIVGIVTTLTRPGQTDQKSTDVETVKQKTTDQAPSPKPAYEAAYEATYIVEYNVVWSQETHPKTFPDGAHVSPIVIVAHANQDDLFATDSVASDGIEIMAETGGTSTLLTEINSKKTILGAETGSVFEAPGANGLEIKLDQDHRLLSAVSMLAPSPDWFVGTRDVNLFPENKWLEELEIKMKAYDAGTDSGATFEASDIDTQPAVNIGPPIDNQFKEADEEGVFAIIKLKLKQP